MNTSGADILVHFCLVFSYFAIQQGDFELEINSLCAKIEKGPLPRNLLV